MSCITKTLRLAALFVVGICIAVNSHAQTILFGNISGTWTPSGNPYIIADNATVPSGQTLTITPGVIVWIGSGVSITVNGGIQAVGTSADHITFQPPINTQYWNTLSVNNGGANSFTFCDFENANTALNFASSSSSQINYCTFNNSINGIFCTSGSNQVNYCTFNNISNTAVMIINGSWNNVLFSTFQSVSNAIEMVAQPTTLPGWNIPTSVTLNADIENCVLSNCSGIAISGFASGWAGSYMGSPPYTADGTINSQIENCSFGSVANGCSFNINSSYYNNGNVYGYAQGNLQIQDNLFNGVSNAAISLTTGSLVGSSTATLINNIIINASNGVVFQDPWDAKMEDSILMGCTNAVQVNGSLSRYVEYNDFYGNAMNFIGYPSTYGTIILVNRNGTPCDLLYNIFSDPKFVAANNFTLQTNSPCIDAGTSDATYLDTSFPPSQGTGLPDLGIYGGPLAVNWLAVIPIPPAPITLSATPALQLTCHNIVATGSYQIQESPDLTNWNDYGLPFYMTATSNLVQYVDATNNAGFFRLKSLP